LAISAIECLSAKSAKKLRLFRRRAQGNIVPHYYFDLTDGIIRRDRIGLDCADDTEAIVSAGRIAKEVAASGGDNSKPDLHISIILNEREVSRVSVPAKP
jgi:hypothetical protein